MLYINYDVYLTVNWVQNSLSPSLPKYVRVRINL